MWCNLPSGVADQDEGTVERAVTFIFKMSIAQLKLPYGVHINPPALTKQPRLTS